MALRTLTDREVKSLKNRPGMHRAAPGLYLRVTDTGAAYWMLRYSVAGKATEMSMGRFDDLTLAEATTEAANLRLGLKRDKVAPLTVKRQEAERGKGSKFSDVAETLIASKRAGWRNAKHAGQWTATLETYAYPVIGDRDVATITTEDVLAVLQPIWTTKPETASRLRGRLESVLNAAKVRGLRSGENPAAWRGHLDHLLPTLSKRQRTQNHPAMAWGVLPAFMAELRARDNISARTLEFTILTAARTGEVIGAAWAEIDLDAKLWTIPKGRMKGKREHRVPLCSEAVELLKALPRIEGNDHIFPGARQGKGISNMAMLELLRGMRPGLTVHGFRSTFRDWAGEATSYPREIIEHALAHQIADATEAAYRRGDALERRRTLMQAWSDYASGKGKVRQLEAAA